MNRALILFLFFSFGVLYAQHSTKYGMTNLSINTKNNEFGVVLTNDGSVFYLKSNSKSSTSINESGANLYKGDLDSYVEFSNGRKFPSDAIHAVFTKNGNTVYFSEKVGDVFQLFKANIDKTGRWKNSIKLPFSNSNFTFKQPALNKSDTKLFFVSDMPSSYGKTDIYFVTISKNGSDLGEPIQLGKNVNTTDTEAYPFIGKQNKLFFSSDNASSIGGLDIFESLYENGQYAKTSNLGTPINSEKDDFAYVLIGNTNNGYLSSNRIDGFGGSDIYYFTDRKPSFNRCDGTINGIVKNKINKKTVFDASVEIFSPQDHMGTVLTNHNGEFLMSNLKCDIRYDVVSFKEGFNGFAEAQTTPEKDTQLILYLDPEFPEEYEEEFDFSNEIVVYDTQTKKIIKSKVENQAGENNELSFAERRDLARLEKETKKIKIIEAEKEIERKKVERKEEARLLALKAQEIAVEKEKRARLAQALKMAEELHKEKMLAEKAEKERVEAEIIKQEKLKAEQKRAKEIAEQKEKEAKIEAEKLVKFKKEQELRLEAERLAEEQKVAKRIEAEKQVKLIAERETAEKIRQERVALAKETAERLKKEKQIAESIEKQKIETERIAQLETEKALELEKQIAEEKIKQENIENERLAQIEKEKEILIEKERISQETREKELIEVEKQKALIVQKNALEKEQQQRIAQAKETANIIKDKKELANEKGQQEIIESERIAQIEKEKEEQLQTETDIITQEQKEKKEIDVKRLEALLAQKEAIEKERKDRIAQVKKRSRRLQKERELAENKEKERIEAERILQIAKEEELQIEAERLANEEKEKIITAQKERIAQAKETAERLKKERELLAKEQEENERIKTEKQTELIAQQETAELENQNRIAQAKETAEKLKQEKEIAKRELAEREENETIETEKLILSAERLKKERELLAKEQEENERIKTEKQTALIAKKEAAELENQNRIAQAKETAEKLKQEKEIVKRELAEREENERIETEKLILSAERLKKERELLAKEQEEKKRIENEKQAELIAQQEATDRKNLEKELAEREKNERIEAEIIAQEEAKAEQKYEKELAEQKIREAQIETEKLAQEEMNLERCSRNIVGAILNSLNGKPIPNATIDIYYDGQNLESIVTDAKGEFYFYNVDCNTRYTLIGFKKDYNNIAKADINTTKLPDQIVLLLEPDPEIIVSTQKPDITGIEETKVDKEPIIEEPKQIVVQKETISPTIPEQDIQIAQESETEKQPNIEEPKIITPNIIGKKIQLNPIYFDLDEWYLTLDARRELDKIIVVMAINKSMIVESGSHTDTRGSFDYNLELSEKRSQETVGYLVANGVDPDRISGRGYGETIPINHCIDGVRCSDREHLQNRRTEFIILKN